MLIHDFAVATSRTVTPEGFLRVRARIGRTGVHLYRAAELGTPVGYAPDDAIRVLRTPDEVFGDAAMASFAGKPVTDGHPPTMVDATNWKRYAVGQSGADVVRDGDHLATDLLITDIAAVKRVEAGALLSNGYLADFEFTPGTTAAGEAYDAVQSNIRGNHIALVDAGRCGESCRIDDAAVQDCGCGTGLVLLELDGIELQVGSDAVAGAEALRRKIEARDGTIAALTARLSDTTVLDELVADRAAVLERARLTLGAAFAPKGLSTGAIRRAVVAKALGTDLTGRSDAYVGAAFDALGVADPALNPLATHLAAFNPRQHGESARRDRDQFLTHAWKGDQPDGAR